MDTTEVLDEIGRQLAVLRDAKRRFSPQLAPDFRVFDYVRGNEVGVSRIIGDLLNPSGSHGQKDVFLKNFLERIDSGGWANSAAVRAVQVEKSIGLHGRLDIYIEFGDGQIAIENKPWAADGEEQLGRYADFLESSKGTKNWKLVYLSNSGPEEHSISSERLQGIKEGGNFVQLGYGELAEWLSRCAAMTRSPRVRFFIEEFIQFVQESINGRLDMTEKNEVIQKALASDDRLSAVVAIQAAWRDIKKELLEKLENDLHEQISKNTEYKGWRVEGFGASFLDGRSEKGFTVEFENGQKNLLAFQFAAAGHDQFYWGISRPNGKGHEAANLGHEINERMVRRFSSGGKPNEWWPWFAYAGEGEFGHKFLNWSTSDEPWILIKNGEFAERILNVASAVYREFQDDMSLLNS